MLIYIGTFLISLICIYLSEYFDKKNKYIHVFFAIIGLILPCLIAGLRGKNVGTDTQSYIKKFYIGGAYTLSDYLKVVGRNMETVFALIMWIVVNYMKKIEVLFFICQALTILPIYIALKKIKNGNNLIVVLGMFIYYMFSFNYSLNIMRQYIAIAFSVLAMVYIEKEEYKKSLFIMLIAFSFHKSVLIMSITYLFTLLLKSRINKNIKRTIEVVSIVIYFIVIYNIIPILTFLGEKNIYYSQYVNSRFYIGSNIQFNIPILWIILLVTAYIFKNRINKATNIDNYYIFSLYLIIIGQTIGTVIEQTNRIVLNWQNCFLILVIPRLCSSFKFKNNRIAISLFYILLFTLSWIKDFVIYNYGGTLPYYFN